MAPSNLTYSSAAAAGRGFNGPTLREDDIPYTSYSAEKAEKGKKPQADPGPSAIEPPSTPSTL